MRFMANYVKMMAVAITAAQRADAKAKQLRRNFCKYCFENWDVSVKILTFVDSLKRALDSNRQQKARKRWYLCPFMKMIVVQASLWDCELFSLRCCTLVMMVLDTRELSNHPIVNVDTCSVPSLHFHKEYLTFVVKWDDGDGVEGLGGRRRRRLIWVSRSQSCQGRAEAAEASPAHSEHHRESKLLTDSHPHPCKHLPTQGGSSEYLFS